MKQLSDWLVALNNNHHWAFAALTVVVMTGLGFAIGEAAGIGFRRLGIRFNKTENKD